AEHPARPRRVGIGRLEDFVRVVLCSLGLEPGDAATTAALMVAADARGADAHGVFRLAQYARRIRSGGINPRPQVTVVEDHPATAVVDGDNGMGHVVMSRAASIAIGKARSAGIGWVGVRRSNHAGPAGLYAAMAAEQSMVGLYLAIGNANHMAPWGGIEPLLSTNPIAVAVPAGRNPPVVLDMATTTVAYGRVKRVARAGGSIPEGWMIDAQGRSLTDPGRIGEGTLLPAGGYKGYGLSLVIGLIAGTLNGAAFGRSVVDFNADHTTVTNTGHSIVAVDVARFMDVATFGGMVDAACEDIQASPPVPGGPPVRIPGWQAAANLELSRRSGVPLTADLVAELDELAGSLGVARL
ncbi:MAG: Ldh family oxidoreductase, partial [Acidimicrobiales bacterium]